MWVKHAGLAQSPELPKKLKYQGFVQKGRIPCAAFDLDGTCVMIAVVRDLPRMPARNRIQGKEDCYVFQIEDKTVLIVCTSAGHIVYCARVPQEKLMDIAFR